MEDKLDRIIELLELIAALLAGDLDVDAPDHAQSLDG